MADEKEDRFAMLYEESKKFAKAIGIPEETVLDIYKAPSDWEFILKVDALFETATRETIKRSVFIRRNGEPVEGAFDGFVDGLPINGRTSLITLLKLTGCPDDMRGMIEGVRRVRNGFAHDIRQINHKLLDVIKARNDKSALLRDLCWIDKYDERELIKLYEKDPSMLRVGILTGMLVFMVMVYALVIEPKQS